MYRVANRPGAFVKQYKVDMESPFEAEMLQKLVHVNGQLLGVQKVGNVKSLLCAIVGRKLSSLNLQSDYGVVLELGFELVQILENVHTLGIVHRDISPQNVFVVLENGRPRHVFLGDFGCAVSMDESHVYEGSVVTAADEVLTLLHLSRYGEFVFDSKMDLESLVKTLWITYLRRETMVVYECNGDKTNYEYMFFAWRVIEEHCMQSSTLKQWLAYARNGDYEALKKTFSTRGRDDVTANRFINNEDYEIQAKFYERVMKLSPARIEPAIMDWKQLPECFGRFEDESKVDPRQAEEGDEPMESESDAIKDYLNFLNVSAKRYEAITEESKFCFFFHVLLLGY